ncbi:hypothetical protein ACFUIW_03520 [Streptomyces sp. NPDC057245]|uniref:hypothetical protein n=1 Tax=Streptomyces sp. NPDC057245 TaxID=3346065 RepID=UPI00363B5C0E
MTDPALPMMPEMAGLVFFLPVHGILTYGRRGAPGFIACACPVTFAFGAPATATGR